MAQQTQQTNMQAKGQSVQTPMTSGQMPMEEEKKSLWWLWLTIALGVIGIGAVVYYWLM